MPKFASPKTSRTLFALVAALAVTPVLADYGDALDTGGGGIARRNILHAQMLLAHGRVTDALAECNHALSLLPNYALATFTCGRAAMAGGDYATAVADFTRVIAAHPEFPFGYEFRALALLRDRRPKDAIDDLNRALTAEIGMGDELASRIFGYRSLAYEILGETDASLADLERSLKPLAGHLDDFTTLSLTCYTAAVVGLLDTAQNLCGESIARKPRNEIAYEARGLADIKQHAWDKAIADFTQMLYYRDDEPMALYGRGLAKRAQGDRQGAAADMAAAKAIEPDVVNIMARLKVGGL